MSKSIDPFGFNVTVAERRAAIRDLETSQIIEAIDNTAHLQESILKHLWRRLNRELHNPQDGGVELGEISAALERCDRKIKELCHDR